MTEEDYDFIIKKGWSTFLGMYAATRLKDDIIKSIGMMAEIAPAITNHLIEAGIVPMTGGAASQSPVEIFFATRSTGKFIRDMFKIPDKVQAAADVIFAEDIARLKEVLASPYKPFAIFCGGARVSSESLSLKLWERFFWKYMLGIAEAAADSEAYLYLHMDGSWDRDLACFRELPKGKCILALDGFTDIYKAKETLGDMMCIMGGIPPALLALGTPDEVYVYCSKLIRDIGPSGYILGPGCVAPANSKPENIKAMLAAATGK